MKPHKGVRIFSEYEAPSLMYTESTSTPALTTRVTDKWHMGRLLSANPECFILPLSNAEHPKTLVLSDFTAYHWDDVMTRNVCEKLLSLMKSGHTIYVCQGEELVKLSPEEVSLLENDGFRKEIRPQNPADILTQLASKHKTPAYKVAMLDTMALQSILGLPVTGVSVNTVPTPKDGFSETEMTVVKSYLNEQQENILPSTVFKEVPDTIVSEATPQRLIAISEAFPDCRMATKYSSYACWKNEDEAKVKEMPWLEEIHFHNYQRERPIVLANKPELKSVHVSLTESSLADLECVAPQIEKLTLEDSDISGFFEIQDKFVNLKHMEIQECASDTKDIEPLVFNNLEIFKINTTPTLFNTIFCAGNKIAPKILSITGEGVTPRLSKHNLSRVTHLTLGRVDLPQLLSLKNATLVKNLSLTLAKTLALCLHRRPDLVPNLNQVESLHLSEEYNRAGSKTPASSLAHAYGCIIRQAKNIKSLELDTIDDEMACVLYNAGTWAQLRHFSVPRKLNKLSEDTIDVILESAPQLDAASKRKLEQRRRDIHNPPENPQRNGGHSNTRAASDNGPMDNYNVDADTRQIPGKTLHAKKIFYGVNGNDPAVNNYRLDIFDIANIDDNAKNPFALSKSAPNLVELQSPPLFSGNDLYSQLPRLQANADGFYYYAKKEIHLSNTWTPLPSLSIRETLTHMHINGLSEKDVDIRHSPDTNQYYIRARDGKARRVAIDYILRTPEDMRAVDRTGTTLPVEIARIVKKYQDFTPGALHIKKGAKGAALLKAIQDQGKGACRHRAFACKKEIERDYPDTQVRVVTNDCHAFVEIFNERTKRWQCCDLGGYEAKLDIDHSNAPATAPPPKKAKILPANSWHNAAAEQASAQQAADLDPEFTTWNIQQNAELSLGDYLSHIVHGIHPQTHIYPINKVLIQVPEAGADAMRLVLQKTAMDDNIPVHYIHSPEDLRCQGAWLTRDNKDDGIIDISGYGGPLYRFLEDAKAAPKQDHILVVNWNNFSAEDTVRYNALLDAVRKIDGHTLPDNVRIIGLHDPKRPGAYNGSDFTSRHTRIAPYTSDIEALQQYAAELTQVTTAPVEGDLQPIPLDLFESPDWKGILLGQWTFQDKSFHYHEGKLAAAIAQARQTHRPITIKNGLWNNKDFVAFWQQAKLQGIIPIEGKTIDIDNICFQQSSGYDWQEYADIITWDWNHPLAEANPHYTLNANNLQKFLSDFSIDNAKESVKTQPGWLTSHAGQAINIYVTSTLPANQWGELLATAREQHVHLNIQVAPNVTLPEGLCPHPLEPVQALSNPILEVFTSDDIDYAAAQLEAENLGAGDIRSIDISACDSTHVISTIHNNSDAKKADFRFTQETRYIWEQLKDGKTVLLHGKCNPELIDTLSTLCLPEPYLWVNGKKEFPGEGARLLMAASNPKDFAFTPVKNITAPITREDKIAALTCYTDGKYTDAMCARHLPPGDLHQYSFVQLQRLLDFPEPKAKIKTNRDAPAELDALFFDPAITAATQQAYVSQIMDVFAKRPYVLLEGGSGTGKSTFVKETLSKQCNMYYGKEALLAWATGHKSQKALDEGNMSDDDDDDAQLEYQCLFFDEYNTTDENYTFLEGLFKSPPFVLIDGKPYPLTEKHKVIFAGNPYSYGERNKPTFCQHHSCEDGRDTVTFKPLPLGMLYHAVIKPLLIQIDDENQKERIARMMLNIYEYVRALKTDSVLISPRELEMMSVMVAMKYQEDPDTVEAYLAYYSHQLICNALPKAEKSAFSEWHQRTIGYSNNLPLETKSDNPLFMGSRRSVYHQIKDLLDLRLFQQRTHIEGADHLGLGGIIFESEPGAGKSTFVEKVLESEGFYKVPLDNLDAIPPEKEDLFYVLPVNLDPEEKVKILLRAFDQGAVVLIDEINSSPMMESLLNDLLMGVYKDGDHYRNAHKPGFKIIATQNPITMEGRRATSTAIERRTMKIHFPDFNRQEMELILQIEEHLPAAVAKSTVQAYMQAREYAIQHHLSPVPNFRTLITVAKARFAALTQEEALPATHPYKAANSPHTPDISPIRPWIASPHAPDYMQRKPSQGTKRGRTPHYVPLRPEERQENAKRLRIAVGGGS